MLAFTKDDGSDGNEVAVSIASAVAIIRITCSTHVAWATTAHYLLAVVLIDAVEGGNWVLARVMGQRSVSTNGRTSVANIPARSAASNPASASSNT